MWKIKMGSRVRFNQLAIDQEVVGTKAKRVGTVVGRSRDGKSWYVIWDGMSPRYREAHHEAFLDIDHQLERVAP